MNRAERRYRFLPQTAASDARRIVTTRGVRALGDGIVAVILPTYLALLGYSAARIGLLVTMTLLGSAAMTLGLGLVGHRLTSRTTFRIACGLMIGTGIGFALVHNYTALLLVAFLGTLNPTGGDVSVFLPAEQSLLPRLVDDRERTSLFARYALTGSLVGAAGAALAGVPEAIARTTSVSQRDAYAVVFASYAGLGIVSWVIYRSLRVDAVTTEARAPLGPSRAVVYRLAALFSVDTFGSGFVTQSLLVLWLHRRFSLSVAEAGALFAVTGILSALSTFGAEHLARRIGLIRTMAYSHLPANVLLVLAAFAPRASFAIVALIVRSLFSQMDVPARTSYVMAIVTPAERPAVASITNVPRSLTAAASPVLAGWMLDRTNFGWPLVIAGSLKATYDIALLLMFRSIRPPEER
jgi:MFS family permease